jgi:hypothetical protein
LARECGRHRREYRAVGDNRTGTGNTELMAQVRTESR